MCKWNSWKASFSVPNCYFKINKQSNFFRFLNTKSKYRYTHLLSASPGVKKIQSGLVLCIEVFYLVQGSFGKRGGRESVDEVFFCGHIFLSPRHIRVGSFASDLRTIIGEIAVLIQTNFGIKKKQWAITLYMLGHGV